MSQITTHVLDTSLGIPASDLAIQLDQLIDNVWVELGAGKTNADGRIGDLLDENTQLSAGTYRMHFSTQAYFEARQEDVFYPYADVVFNISIEQASEKAHFHIPLLLTPYSYSTYRGS